jgi:hypothetical protein
MSMGKRILASICFCLLVYVGLPAGKASGQEMVKVGILPFKVYAPDREKLAGWPMRLPRSPLLPNRRSPLRRRSSARAGARSDTVARSECLWKKPSMAFFHEIDSRFRRRTTLSTG